MNEPFTWQQIPGWFDFNDVYQDAVNGAPPTGAHFVEIGVLCGKSTLFMAETIRRSGKKIIFDAVDPMNYNTNELAVIATKCPPGDNTQLNQILTTLRQVNPPDAVSHIIKLSNLGDLVHLVRAKGQLWAHNYPAESLDFVYVDAQHTYEDTEQILRAYLPKLRRGGILAGHDYNPIYPGIIQAVHEVLGTKIVIRRQSFVWTK